MAKYDGLIIPRSYSDYLNKTDGATLSQMLDSIGGTYDASPTPNSVKPARSGGIFAANAVITSDNTTLTGVTISERSVVRVMFTADLTGSDATTGLTLTYNGTAYAVKVGKDGALKALTAHLVEESYIYLLAYTTLELAFDGSQFIVMGNPVVISNADFCIMADGSITYTNNVAVRKYLYTNYLKITFNTFIPSALGSVNILYGGRGSTGLILIGSNSYADYTVTKEFTRILDAYIPLVYIKNVQSNNPIYIDTGSGQKANVIIMSQNVGIASIEQVDTVPSDYTAY